jgi:hypothetical protein
MGVVAALTILDQNAIADLGEPADAFEFPPLATEVIPPITAFLAGSQSSTRLMSNIQSRDRS